MIYLHDVSKTVMNHVLKQCNVKDRHKLKRIKYSNENVAHEMRAPLGSIIVFISILLSLGRSAKDLKRARSFYR